MNFDTWYDLYSYPYESREDAAERFADEQGYENPAEKQGFLDSLPEYETITPLDQQAGYDYGFGDWTPPEPAPITTPPEYEDDPSVWESGGRGIDLAQASLYGFGEGPVSGFLDDLGFEDASAGLKEWSREGRIEQERQAAQVAPAKSIKEEIAANPESWYQYLDEDMMTWGQMAEAAPTSLAPFAAALPLALATPYLAAAAGIAATGTLGSTLLSAGVGMGVGNLASSAIVSSEAYERGKNERVIREQLGVDPDKKFEDLLPSDQQKVDRVATDLSQTSFGHRLYTAGLVEMASYIPYGHAMVRLALDTGLGTASEVWDRTLYSEDAVDALIENGVPPEKAEELREAIIQAGPGLRETLIAALQQEFVMGGAATGIESLVGKTAPQVNALATSTKEMKKEIKNASELYDKQEQGRIEGQRKTDQLELKSELKRREDENKLWLNDQFKQQEENRKREQEKTPEELALEKQQAALDEMVPAVIEEDTGITYEDVQELEGQQKALEDSLVEEKTEPYKSIAEEKAKRKRFDANLPISVADLNKQKKIIEEEQAKYKEGSDLKRGAQERLKAIDAKIKELTPQLRTAEEIRTEKIKNREREASIKKERGILANIEKKLYGAKGEKGADRTFWKQEKFVEERFYKKRKLALEQQEEIARLTEGEYQSETGEEIQRRRRIQEEAREKLAEDLVDQTLKRSAIQSEGTFSFDTNFIQKYVDDLGKRFEKYKGIYTVLSANSPQDLANIFLSAKHQVKDTTTGKMRRITRPEAMALAEEQLDGVNAFVYGDHVYVVAENIRGADKKAAMENLVKIVTFHEPITHLGLKEYLGDRYIPFLDDFYNTNKTVIRNWAETEALTEGDKTPAYLLSEADQSAKEKGLTEKQLTAFRDNQNRTLAEEFLANKFVELGIADPDILTRTADSLLSALKGIVDPLNRRISTVEARSVLAEVQRSYLGGKKNIITGSLFDPANWTMKGFEVAAGEDKVEAYRKYLKEQGIEYKPTVGETKTVSGVGAIRRKSTLQKAIDATPEEEKKEADKKSPTRFTEKRQQQSQLLRIKAEEKRIKKGKKKLDRELKKKRPVVTLMGERPDVIFASKRIMSPRQAEIWKARNKGKGKGRKPRNPFLVALAKKLETGKASYEEYRDKVNELLPIKKFQSVPKPASDEVILGSIDKGQYRKGLLLGEDTLKSGKDIVNVRLDIPAYERFDSWVATITHAGDTIYGAAVRLKNVTFKAPPRGALRIAQGEEKTTLATMKGTWQGDSITTIEKMANDYINDPAWVQIGYNPERQSSFYLREDKGNLKKGTPLASAEEVIQVGAFVLAKNVTTKATPSLTIGDVTFQYSKKLVSAKDFKTIKPPNLRFTKLQRKIYALLKTPAKGIEYTRKYLNRKNHPSPTNKSEAFELPNGHKVWLGSGKTVDNWIEQVESVLTPAEIKRERNWYPKVKKLFEDTFGKDDAPKMILAWALGNKAESPLGAMKNVLRARENLAKKINKDLMKKGGLNDAAITSILKDLPPEGGSGVKLFDFVDASIDSTTRVWTGHDSRMGGPAVVDRHTWRDGGYLDDALLNILKEGLPNDPRVKKLKLDREKPSVTDAEYEQTAMWLRDITIALNAKKFAGVNNWTPNAVQAVGWMSMAKITGQAEGGTAVQAIRETTRDVLFEITPGTGAPLLGAYPQLNKLTADQRRTLASNLGDVVTDIALKETGVLESVREKGTGWYLDNDAQPNILTRVNASKDGLLDLIHIIGYLAQQDSVLAYGAQSNARQIGIDFVETDGKFSDTKLLDKFYKGLRKAHPKYFSGGTEGIVRGKPVFRALLFDPQAPLRLKVGERKLWIKKEAKRIKKEILPTVQRLANDLDLDIRLKDFAMTTISADNNWKKEPDGTSYRRRIVQRFRPHISRRILDNGPKKVEKAIRKQFDEFGIKYSKKTVDGRDGTASQRTYEGRLDVESDGQSHFVHWSNSPDLAETDPSYHGTGIAGRESENKRKFPDEFVPRTYVGLPGYNKEGGLGKNMYEIQLDPNTLYDGNNDPDGFIIKIKEELGIPTTQPATAIALVKYENSIKEAGYVGYFNISAKIAALFNPTKLNFTKEIIGPSTFVPSIRGDQSIKYSKAFHGTGKDFYEEGFSTDKVGTGEGGGNPNAGMEGWGLYFSSKTRVAKWYRDNEMNKVPRRPMSERLPAMTDNDISDYFKKGNRVTIHWNPLNFEAFEKWKNQVGNRKEFKIVSDIVFKKGGKKYSFTDTQGKTHPAPPYFIVKASAEVPVMKKLKREDGNWTGGPDFRWEQDSTWLPDKKKRVYKKETKKFIITNLDRKYREDYPNELVIYQGQSWTSESQQRDFKKVTGRQLENYKEPEKGKIYEVELAPKDHEYLMLDTDMLQQSKTVKDTLKNTYPGIFDGLDIVKGEMTGREFYRRLTKDYGSKKAASQYLLSKGVRGNKYYTGSTRNKAGAKDYNYVIFDDADVTIDAMYSKRLAQDDQSIKYSKRVYHGSPKSFDKFTTSMIGTGEGAQARGWGLYFTAKKEVANWYKENLSQFAEPEYTQDDLKDYWKKDNVIQLPLTGQLVPWKSIEPIIPLLAEQHGMKPNDYLATISRDNMPEAIVEKINLKPNGNIKSVQLQEVKRMTRQEDKYGDGRVTETEFFETVGKPITIPVFDPVPFEFTDIVKRKAPTKAKLYEVDIAPKDSEYLHLDVPLKDQSKKVEGAAKKIVGKWVEKELVFAKNDPRYFTRNKEGRDHWKDIYAKMTGDQFVDWIQNNFDGSRADQKMMASQYLLYHGVRGNKYYTGETRNKDKKDFNYVIFDQEDVTIQAMYSKTLQTGQELEAEWRANAKVAPPEKKEVSQKDKVTLSKEAKAILKAKPTTADISPKAILDPDGNIKTSKILASRAAMFALRSGGVNTKGMPWRYRLAERLTRSITPQGSLPDRLKYLTIRRLIKGKIKGAEDASKALYNILKNTKQADVIYKYFTTRDFDANKITNKTERKAAVEAKGKIDEIGEQLVKSDLLDKGAREQYKGMYLPQVYLKYLLKEGDDPFIKVRGGGGIQIDQNYLKKRLSEQELPKEIRELILGEIKDPAYLASKAISIPAKDMAILDWLQQIAGNEDWVAKDSLVNFDTFAEIRKAKLPLEVQKALELKDTTGVKVSGHWLKNESERIWSMTKYMNLDKADMDIVENLVIDMAKVSDKAFDKPYDPKLYAIVPKTKKYGMLAGMALRKEIANDIFGGMNMTTGDVSMAEGILGDGGKLGQFNRFWKWSKVSANPPSWVRNFVSNMILMNMSGVPFYKMPFLIKDSLRDMQGKGKHKGRLHQLAKDLGLTAGNFSNIELGRIEREFKDLQIRMKNKGGPMGVIGMIKGALNKVQDVTSDTYGGIDTLGKMMVLKHNLDKGKIKIKDLAEYKGAEKETLDDIAYNAEKWLFDYSNVLPSVKYLRNVPFGAPFASFTSFVAPLMLETAITKPWKFLPYYALGYAMKEMFKDNFELDDEQYEGFKVSMSDYLREKAYGSIFPTAVIPFPYLDDNKRIQFMDVSYLYPWGMFSEMAGEITEGKAADAVKTAGLLGSPGLNIASAIMTGIDPFTRRQIVDETGTNIEKAADLVWYAWNLSAPPMLHGIWQGPGEGYGAVKRLKDAFTGALAKDGEAKFTKGQAVGRMFGMNITPIAVPEGRNKHLRWEYSKHNKLVYRAKRELTNMLMMQMDMDEIKKEGKKWGKKILKSQEEFREKVKISVPPITLLREREKFLREQRRSAQQYRASL